MMVRALVWKEWREQRAVVLAGLLLAVALPPFLLAGMSLMGSRVDIIGLAQALPMVYAGLLWPLLAAAAGAGTVASEVGNGTLGFLLSRPASRARIWWVKTATALMSIVVVAAGTLGIAAAFRALVGSGGRSAGGGIAEEPGLLVLLAAISVVFFSVAAFLSTVLERAMTAAAGGVAVSLAIVAAIGGIWARLDLVPTLEAEWLTLEFFLAGLAILPASLYVFARGELLRGRGARRAALLGASSVVLLAALVSVPIVWWVTRLDATQATLWNLTLSPARDAVLTTASARDGGSAQVWWIPTDGSGPQRRTGRLSFGGTFTGSQGVAYLSQRGLLGLRSSAGTAVRWQSADGSEDRVLDAGLPSHLAFSRYVRDGAVALLPSPSGELIAISLLDRIVVADRNGAAPRAIDLAGTALARGRAIGWNPAGDALILFRSRWRDDQEAVLGVYELRSGSVRPIFRSAEPCFPRWAPDSPSSRASILLQATGAAENRLFEVDLADGAERTLAHAPCILAAATAANGQWLAYSTCIGEKPAPRSSEIHLVDRRTGEDRLLGSVKGLARELFLSPAADRVLLALYDSDGVRAAIVGGETPAVIIDGDWSPLGWTGKDQVVLYGDGQTPAPLVVAAADGSLLRSLIP